MIRNAVIALTAAGAMGLALAPAAQARNNIDINLTFGTPGYHGIYFYGDHCFYKKVKHVKWNKWHTKKVVYFTKKLICY